MSLHLTIYTITISLFSAAVYGAPQTGAMPLFAIADTTNSLGADSFEGMGKWNDCPEGEVIAGFKNTWDTNCRDHLHCLEGIQCVSPLEYPVKTRCYDAEIIGAFDNPGAAGTFATVECKPGYFLRGLYSYNNNDGNCGLNCIEAMRCCQYDTRVVWSGDTVGQDNNWWGCLDQVNNYLNQWCLVAPWNFVTGLVRNGGGDGISLLEAAKVRSLYKSTAVNVRNFAIIPSKETWQNAQNFCNTNYGTDLATIKTSEEISAILMVLRAHGWDGEAPWIGINDIDVEGTFKWKSGAVCDSSATPAALCSTFWESGEPSNGNNENCGELRGWSGKLNDGDCTTANYFICNVREFEFEVSGTWLKVPSCIGCASNEYKVTVGVTNVKEDGTQSTTSVELTEAKQTNYNAEISASVETFFGSVEASMSWGGSNSLSQTQASEVSNTMANTMEHSQSKEFTIQCSKDAIYQYVTNIKQRSKITGVSKAFNVNNPDYICLSVPNKPKCGPGCCSDQNCQTCLV